MAEFKAKAKYIRVSPYKIRPIANSIKGKPADEAVSMLMLQQKRVGQYLLKVLNSAIANASSSELRAKPENLRVERAFIDEGPTLKRVRFRAMGRVNRILKRTSHITVILTTTGEEEVSGTKG